MDQKKFKIDSKKDSADLAKKLADRLSGGEVFLLSGILGAGKTFFSGLLAKNLGVEEEITSPTFSLCREYSCRKETLKKIFHLDLYRLESYSQLKDLAFEDILKRNDSLTLIEWPDCIKDVDLADKIKELVPNKRIYRIIIIFAGNLKDREITLEIV